MCRVVDFYSLFIGHIIIYYVARQNKKVAYILSMMCFFSDSRIITEKLLVWCTRANRAEMHRSDGWLLVASASRTSLFLAPTCFLLLPTLHQGCILGKKKHKQGLVQLAIHPSVRPAQ